MSYTSNISHGSHQNNESHNQAEKNSDTFKSIVASWYNHTLSEVELLEKVESEFTPTPFQQDFKESNTSIKKIEKQALAFQAEKKNDATPKQPITVEPKLKSNSPAFTPKSAIKNPYLNSFDDATGIYFSYYLTHLKKVVNENFHIKIKSEVLARTLKAKIEKGFEVKSPLFFLAAFQICAYLPENLQNDVFKILVEDFKNISFENTCPLAHAIHTLTFSRKQSFGALLNFLTVLSFFHLNNDASNDKHIRMTYKTNSRFENAVPHPISAIHLKTDSFAITIEIPFQTASIFDHFNSETKLLSFTHLLCPLLPKVCIDYKKQFFSGNISLITKIEDFANELTLNSNPYLRLFGLRYLIELATKKKIDSNSFEKKLLMNLPLFIFSISNGEPNGVLSELKKLGIEVLSNLSIDTSLPLDLQKSTLIKKYIKELLQHKDVKNQKIALELWKAELFSSDSEIQKDWIAFGEEIYSVLASKTLYPEIADKSFEILKELIEIKAFSSDFSDSWLAEFGLKICESNLNEGNFSSFFVAFNQWSFFNSISLFDLKGYRLKEHSLIVKLMNMIFSQDIKFESCKHKLYPKLFAIALNKEMYVKFRLAFVDYLKDLSLIGHETEVLKLLKNQPYQDLSKIEQEVIQLNKLQGQREDSKKIETLLKISKQGLSKESKAIVTNLSFPLIKSLLKKGEITLALDLASKTLFDEVTHLFSLLTIILKEENISDKKSCHHILNIILSSNQISGDDLSALIESSIEKLKPFPNDLKNSLKKFHLNFHKELMKNGQHIKALSFFKTLLKELHQAEIFPNAPDTWVEFFSLVNRYETLEFKEELLKSLLANKSFNAVNKFYILKNASQELISSYFACDMPEKAIEFALYFQNFESIHEFSEISLKNFNECLDKSLSTGDTVKSLTFFRLLAEKNKSFSKDTRFLGYMKLHLDILFEKKEYVKWMEVIIEFSILEKDERALKLYKEAILSTLIEPSFKKNLETIFTLLTFTLHPDIELWHELFKKIKESNFADLKMKIAYELKNNPEFRNLFAEKGEPVFNCFLSLLDFVSFSKDLDIAYTMVDEYPETIFEMLDQNSSVKETASELLGPLLGKLFRHLKSNPLKKQALLKKIIPYHSKTHFIDFKQKWIFKKLILDATCDETDTDLLVAGAVNLFSLSINPIFETSFKELVPSLMQILKRWPEIQPKNVKCYVKQDVFIQNEIPSAKKEVDINYVFCQTARLIIQRDNSIDTYFEQFYKLIQHGSENYQLLAMLLYKKSVVALEKASKSNVSLKSQTTKIANNHLLQMAFKSEFKSVYMAALDVFHRESYRLSLKKQDTLAFALFLIEKTMEHPAESYKESHDINNICQLFTNLEVVKHTPPNPAFIDFYAELNKKVLTELNDSATYLANHNFMFVYIFSNLETEFQSGIKNLKLIIRLITLVNSGWNLVKEYPAYHDQMHASLAQELSILIHSPIIDSRLLDQIFQNFLYATDHIWDDHEENHIKMLSSLLSKPNDLSSNSAFVLLFKKKFIELSGELKILSKSDVLISLIKKIDKNTPVTILSRVLHTLLAQKEHLAPPEFFFCITHFLQTVRTRVSSERDGTIFAVIHWMKFIFFEKIKKDSMILFNDEKIKILPSFMNLYKTDSKKAITLYLDYINTIKQLLLSTTDQIFYFDTLKDIIYSDTVLEKFGIQFKDTEDILSYSNLMLDLTIPHALQFPDRPFNFSILPALLNAKTTTPEMKKKKQQLIIRILNDFIKLSLNQYHHLPLKMCIPLFCDTFHFNFNLMESDYIKVSELIKELKKNVS